MNYYIYAEDENGNGVLLKKENTSQGITDGWEPDMKIQMGKEDTSVLRAELDRIIAWKNEQTSRTDNNKVDTLQEVIDEVQELGNGNDISRETIDGWF